MSALQESIIEFTHDFVNAYQEKLQHLPLVEEDDDWPSPCIQKTYQGNLLQWVPVQPEKPLSFHNIESALNLELHSSFKEYFSTVFSENIPATCSEGNLQLLFAWSEDDFARLQENIVGHVLMKQKLKQEITLFFAVTDDDDIMLTVNNNNGEIWAEKVGCKPHKKIADTMKAFIDSLQPDIYIAEES